MLLLSTCGAVADMIKGKTPKVFRVRPERLSPIHRMRNIAGLRIVAPIVTNRHISTLRTTSYQGRRKRCGGRTHGAKIFDLRISQLLVNQRIVDLCRR